MSVKIYVGNINFKTTEDDLRTVFAGHGDVEEVFIATDRETGRPRGFAFVTMRDDSQAKAAITAVNGQEVGGRVLVVNEARPREGSGSGGGGGFRGGGGGRGGRGGGGGGGGRGGW